MLEDHMKVFEELLVASYDIGITDIAQCCVLT